MFELLQETDWQRSVLSHFIAMECEDLAHYSSFSPNKHLIHPTPNILPVGDFVKSSQSCWKHPHFTITVLTFKLFLARGALKFLGIFTASLKMISELQTHMESLWQFSLVVYRNVKSILRCQTAINRQSPEPLCLVGKNWLLQIIKWRYLDCLVLSR